MENNLEKEVVDESKNEALKEEIEEIEEIEEKVEEIK